MRAIVYIRVSTDEQADSGLGLQAQVHSCAALIDRLGITDARLHADEGISGDVPIRKRPGLQAALEELARGDVLIVAKLDRLSRSREVSGDIDREIKARGASRISAAGEGTGSNKSGDVIQTRVAEMFSEHEKLVIGERTKAGLDTKRRNGELVGTLAYGLKVSGQVERHTKNGMKLIKLVEPDPAELAILDRIGALRALGISLGMIAKTLNAESVPTRSGRPWSKSTIQTLTGRMQDATAQETTDRIHLRPGTTIGQGFGAQYMRDKQGIGGRSDPAPPLPRGDHDHPQDPG